MKHDFEWKGLVAICKTCGKKVTAAAMMGGPGNPFEEQCPKGPVNGARATVYMNGQPIGTVGNVTVPEFNENGWRDLEKTIKPLPQGCECGAHKVLGVGRHQIGHSSWCPWRKP